MTTNLHARAAKAAELNAKRTQGEWCLDHDDTAIDGENPLTHDWIVPPPDDDYFEYCDKTLFQHNMRAIAALPEAFALIAELDAALTSAEAKLTGIEPKEKP